MGHYAIGVQEANSNIEEDDERSEIQKSQMKNDEDKQQIIDPTANTIFIFNLQMNNNYNCAIFGMQRSKDDMSGISAKLIRVFIRSSGVFA